MSKGEILMLGKLALTFIVLLGIPLWELYSLRRARLARERHQGKASSKQK